MRKLLKITTTFALALVLTAGMAFAQNEGEIDQEGDKNTARVWQSGNITKDNPDFNQADVRQEGISNKTLLRQGSFGVDGHDTDIDQVGNNNLADVTASGGSNGLQGNDNELDIVQRGNQNNFQTSKLQSFQSDYDVEQVGNKNYAEIETRFGAGGTIGQGTFSVIQKFGNNNSGVITATSGGNNHFLQIKQKFGDSNEATITHELPQGASGVDGIVGKVTQFGGNNEAHVDLLAEPSDRGVITQDGNDNYATIEHN